MDYGEREEGEGGWKSEGEKRSGIAGATWLSRQIVALIKFKRIFKFRFICSIYILKFMQKSELQSHCFLL